MTNFECIKSMSIEQLAQLLDDTQRRECEEMHVVNDDGTLQHQSLARGWANWLNSEAEFHDKDGSDASKICATCQYGKLDNLGDRICANDKSENCANWVSGFDTCDYWEGES